MDIAVQAIRPRQRESRASYRIPDVYLTVRWARYLGRDRHIFIDWQAPLDAMKASSVDAYNALGEQAEQFFHEVALDFDGNMPAILPVLVPHAGMILRLAVLGSFYHIRYGNIKCVIPQRVMVGKWEQSTPHPVGKKY